MSNNVYLKKHVYRGQEEARIEGEQGWWEAFDEVDPDTPLWRAVSEDSPLIHVCLLADRIYWAMPPDHVKVLARWFKDKPIFSSETHDLTGAEFLERIEGYTKAPLFKVGEWFS